MRFCVEIETNKLAVNPSGLTNGLHYLLAHAPKCGYTNGGNMGQKIPGNAFIKGINASSLQKECAKTPISLMLSQK